MRNWASVDLSAIGSNFRHLRTRAGGRPVLAVVKSNAYGHGAPKIARYLQRLGCERLAVATAEEALALRDAGCRVPIHMLACVPPADYETVVGEDFVFTIGSAHEARVLAEVSARAGSRETVHIEIDTGMGRSGCRPQDAAELVSTVVSRPSLRLEGAMTHFPSADDLEDPDGTEFARHQVAQLVTVERVMRAAGVKNPLLHAANSAGVALIKESHLSFVRPGGALFGIAAGRLTTGSLALRPALSWKATVVQVRDFVPSQTIGYGRSFVVRHPMRVATVSAGYGDGYSRSYGPSGSVLIAGSRAPIVGRVSMDSMCVDVTSIPSVGVGDEVVLVGRQGRESISIKDLASLAKSSPYEVTCKLSSRVVRVYHEDEA